MLSCLTSYTIREEKRQFKTVSEKRCFQLKESSVSSESGVWYSYNVYMLGVKSTIKKPKNIMVIHVGYSDHT